ncbi:MAG: helix-turn-helix domain-containing protein [Methylobacter sp.]|uniref:helix-turn-helix domain-containing protein n=1 Tax=Methylobacter sp. TaxID=2051955 RepID=UPI00258E0592|nr:helix-turn-helix transcriptional regulator [Methylobacter sp.]MCL7420861.1 helix-turn-helix domain-containing protein [Methylobacter sp.]
MHKRLQEERHRLGLNQDEFAEIGGVKRRAQINYESGERCPDGHYFAAIAAAGADVQYILTGVRSSAALALDEQQLLDRYRTSPKELKDAALRVLLLGDQTQSSAKFVVHGDVGQQFDKAHNGTFNIDMRKEEKKKK